jgi:hypothetical protein
MSAPRTVALGVAALLAWAGEARAQCVYSALTSGVAQPTSNSETFYSLAQTQIYWTAVAVRPPAGEDWDLGVYSGTAAYPVCVSGPLASSGAGLGVADFVMGDFNHDPLGTYYAYAYRYSGTGNALVQWDDGPDQVFPDGPTVTQSTGPAEVIKVWDVSLTSGRTYVFSLSHIGSGHISLLLFANPGGGVYWAGRSAAVLQVTGTGCASYAAPATGFYGLAVVNDDGGTDAYSIGVSSQPCACPGGLPNGVPITDLPFDQVHSFTQSAIFWSAVAVQSSADWDIQLGTNAGGAAAPQCIGNVATSSSLASGVADFVVGDFNHTPPGTYYVRTHEFAGSASASTEWYGGSELLRVNAPLLDKVRTPGEIIETYDVFLEAGKAYHFRYLSLSGFLKGFVFRNPGTGPYFAGRNDADLTLGTFYDTDYLAPTTGFCGIVIVSDTGAGGEYWLQVTSCTPPVPLADKVPVSTTNGFDYYSFTTGPSRWGAIGVSDETVFRSIGVYSSPTGDSIPGCLGGELALSRDVSHNLVVGDMRFNPPATYYSRVGYSDFDQNAPSHVKWDSGDGTLTVNDNNWTTRSQSPADWFNIFDVQLQGLYPYYMDFTTTPAQLVPDVYLFGNPGNAAYWAPLRAREYDSNGGLFFVLSGGSHAAVVTFPNLQPLTYSMRIRACPPHVTLVSGVPVPVEAMGFFEFTQSVPFWTAMGVRSTSSDWDIEADQTGINGDFGVCFTNPLAVSADVGHVDFVVGDFNTGGNAYSTYYLRPYRYSGSTPGLAEWDGGADLIAVGAPPVHRAESAADVLECWDVFLEAGQTYTVFLKHDVGVDAKVDLFRSLNAPYWAPRSSRVYEGSSTGTFVAPATDYYGLVLVNDNGGSGGVDVGVYPPGVLAVDGGAATPATALTSIAPNPGRGNVRLQYALGEGGAASFDVVDMAGRIVSHLEDAERAAGNWSVDWPAAAQDGRRLPAGLYFVRMKVAGRVVATRRVTLLD